MIHSTTAWIVGVLRCAWTLLFWCDRIQDIYWSFEHKIFPWFSLNIFLHPTLFPCFCFLVRFIWSLLCMYHKTKQNTAQWARPTKTMIRTSIEINRNCKYHEQKRVTTRNMTSRLKRRKGRSEQKIFACILFPVFMCIEHRTTLCFDFIAFVSKKWNSIQLICLF